MPRAGGPITYASELAGIHERWLDLLGPPKEAADHSHEGKRTTRLVSSQDLIRSDIGLGYLLRWQIARAVLMDGGKLTADEFLDRFGTDLQDEHFHWTGRSRKAFANKAEKTKLVRTLCAELSKTFAQRYQETLGHESGTPARLRMPSQRKAGSFALCAVPANRAQAAGE